jgi:O-antigen ligase
MRSETAAPYLREHAGSGPAASILLLALVGFAAACGVMVALGETQALYISLALIASLVVLYDFRVGAVLLVVLLPLSASSLFPSGQLGIRGLNPINLLVLGTLASFVLHGGLARPGVVLPRALVLAYLPPFLLAGLLGVQRVDDIPPIFYEMMLVDFNTAAPYVTEVVVKPLLIVVMAMMVAAAVARSRKPERLLTPLLVSIWALCALAIGFVALSGVALNDLARADARGFYATIGMHANELGRLFLMAYALLLFTWWETKSPWLQAVLFVTLGVVLLALVLTFSRAAFLGFLVVSGLFVLWKFNAKTLALALLAVVLGVLLMPEAVYQRATLGFASGDLDEVSAGRVAGLWLPLLPEALRAPPWGYGLGSILWSDYMRGDTILPTTHPHNAYLQAWMDTGVIGLVLMLVFYAAVWRGFRSLSGNPHVVPELRGFFQGAAAGLVAFLVTGWAGSSLMPARDWVFLWVAIGFMYGMLARRPAG